MSAKKKSLKSAVETKSIPVDAKDIPIAQSEAKPNTSAPVDASASGKLLKLDPESAPNPASLKHLAFPQTLEDIKLSTIVRDVEWNKRDEKRAYDMKTSENVRDLAIMKEFGIMPGHPLLVHRNTMALQGNTNLQLIQGFRRAALAEAAGIETVPCLTFTGATNEILNSYLIDPPGVKPDRVGRLKAFKRLYASGITNKQTLCQRSEISSDDYQEYHALARLPQSYVDMWISYQRNKDDKSVLFTPTRPNTIVLLAAQTRDEKGEKDSNDNWVRLPWGGKGPGPLFQDQFNKLVAVGKGRVAPKVNTELEKFSSSLGHAPVVQSLVRGLANSEGIDREAVINTAIKTVTSYATLKALAEHVNNVYFDALIIGPDAKDDIEKTTKHEAIAQLFVDAITHFVGVYPERDLLAPPEAVKPEAVKPEAVKPKAKRKTKV
jgi:hypothetical protein